MLLTKVIFRELGLAWGNGKNSTAINTPIQLRSRASSLALQYEAPGVRFFSVWFSLGSMLVLQFQLLNLPTLGKLSVISCLFDLVYTLSHLRKSF